MPDVFEDTTANSYDLTITTSADWTVSSGGMPNSDNYVTGDGSIAATYNTSGNAFDFRDGTAWTIECWLYIATPITLPQIIMVNAANGTTTRAWSLYLETDESVRFYIENTTGGAYLDVQSSVLSTSAWHHIVGIKETGNTLRLYVDNVQVATDTSTSGTARTPDATYYLYLGTEGDGTSDIGASSSAFRISKLAIYNLQLSAGQINDHYLAMVAT